MPIYEIEFEETYHGRVRVSAPDEVIAKDVLWNMDLRCYEKYIAESMRVISVKEIEGAKQ